MEINTFIVLCLFDCTTKDPKIVPNLLDFCCELTWQLIDNTARENVEDVETTINMHRPPSFATVFYHKHYFHGQVWDLDSKQKYQQYQCKWSGYQEQTASIANVPLLHGCVVSVMSNTVWMSLE